MPMISGQSWKYVSELLHKHVPALLRKHMSELMRKYMPERLRKHMPGRLRKYMPERLRKHVPKQLCGQVPGQASTGTSEPVIFFFKYRIPSTDNTATTVISVYTITYETVGDTTFPMYSVARPFNSGTKKSTAQ